MIRILDENLKVIETVITYTSISWTHRYTDVGSFEMQIPLAHCPVHLKDGVYIRHYDNYGIIRYIHQDNAYISVQGYDLKGLLSCRVAFGSKSGKLETVLKEYVSQNTQGNRSFPLFNIAEDKQSGEDITYNPEGAGERLDNLCKTICEQNGIGYKVYVKDENIYFDMTFPDIKDYTYSKRRNNISEYEYTKDNLDDINCAYQVLKPEGFKLSVDGNKITVGTGTACFNNGAVYSVEEEYANLYSSSGAHYFYVSCRLSDERVSVFESSVKPSGKPDTSDMLYFYIGHVTDGKIYDNEVSERIVRVIDNDSYVGHARKEGIIELSGNNDENAQSLDNYLNENKAVENIQASIFDPKNYKKEWQLGDYINVRLDVMGEALTVSRQVSEVTEVFESGNHTVSCVFGNVRESVLRKIIKGRMR